MCSVQLHSMKMDSFHCKNTHLSFCLSLSLTLRLFPSLSHPLSFLLSLSVCLVPFNLVHDSCRSVMYCKTNLNRDSSQKEQLYSYRSEYLFQGETEVMVVVKVRVRESFTTALGYLRRVSRKMTWNQLIPRQA